MSFFRTDKKLKIDIVNSKTKDVLSLYYNILNTDISDRWINLINQNNEKQNSLRFNYRKIFTEEEIEDRFKKFKQNK